MIAIKSRTGDTWNLSGLFNSRITLAGIQLLKSKRLLKGKITLRSKSIPDRFMKKPQNINCLPL